MKAHDRANTMAKVRGELEELKKLCCSNYCSSCLDCKNRVMEAIYHIELMDKGLVEDLLDKT